MHLGHELPEVGNRAHVPEEADALWPRTTARTLSRDASRWNAAHRRPVGPGEDAARGGGARERRARASTDRCRGSSLRHSRRRTGGKRCVSIARPTPPAARAERACRTCRPGCSARRAPRSARARRRRRRGLAPVELRSAAKATWSMSMFSPMPIASVATRYSTSPDWNMATWALRVRGERAPRTTAAPPRRGGARQARRRGGWRTRPPRCAAGGAERPGAGVGQAREARVLAAARSAGARGARGAWCPAEEPGLLRPRAESIRG